MKKIISLLLTVAMVLTMVPAVAFAGTTDECQGGEGCKHAAKIDNTHYDTLAEAIAAATNGVETEVDVIADIEYNTFDQGSYKHAAVAIPSTKNIVLDLNGHTISAVSDVNGATELLYNMGTLKITDSKEDGKFTYKSNHPDGSYGYGTNTILNRGILTIAGGTIENTTTGGASYAVDSQTYWYDAIVPVEFTLTGGNLICTTGDAAIRQAAALGEKYKYQDQIVKNYMTISGGKVTGDIWVQSLEVENVGSHSELKINGGEITGKVYDTLKGDGSHLVYDVTGGYIGQIGRNDGSMSKTGFVSGGYFEKEVPAACISDGYECVADTTVTGCSYKVQAKQVAKIGETIYPSLEAAVAAVQDNETITLLKDSNVVTDYAKAYGESDYSEAVGANRLIIGANGAKNFTLDLNGKTLTGRINFLHGNLTIKNGKLRSGSQAINIYGSKDYNDRNTNYTVVTIANDVEITSDIYGVAVFGGNPNSSYWPLGFGEVVNFYGKVTAPVGIGNSGNIGMDTYEANLGKVQEIENLVQASDCNSCSELMAKYGPVLNFYDGAVVNASEQAVYWPGLGKINVMGGSITGTEAIGIKGGIVNVSGGTLTATGPKCDPVAAVNSGEEASGAAISISTYYNANYPITVNISGGTFRSTNNVALLVAHSVKNTVKTPVTQGINLTVSGGMFSGASELGGVYVETALEGEAGKYPTKFITGGLFDKNVTAYVADGYVCVANTDPLTKTTYPYVVKTVEVKVEDITVNESTGEIKSGEKVIPVAGTGTGSEQGQPTAQEAANKITATLNNPEVTGFADTKIEEATPVTEQTTVQNVDQTGFNLSMILDAVKEEAAKQFAATVTNNNEITVKPTDTGEGEKFVETDVSKQIKVDLTAAAVTKTSAQATTTTVTSMTFDVKPVANITVTKGAGEAVTVTAVIPNEAITAPITFRLPVDSSVTEKWAAVYHEGVFMGNYEIKMGTDSKKYIEVSSMEFSKFKYVLFSSESAAAKIGDTPYQTLAEAVAAVKNGETIVLLKAAASGTIAVDRKVTFTIDNNGQTNGVTISVDGEMKDSLRVDKTSNDDSALYEIKELFTVTAAVNFDTRGSATVQLGESGEAAPTIKAAEGDKLIFKATPAEEYEFMHWDVQGTSLTYEQYVAEDLTITMPANNLTLTAVFEQKQKIVGTHQIIIDIQGFGTVVAKVNDDIVVAAKQGEEVTLVPTAFIGYKFDKWEVVSGGITITDNKFTMPEEDVLIKAIFKEKPADPSKPEIDRDTLIKVAIGGAVVGAAVVGTTAIVGSIIKNRLEENATEVVVLPEEPAVPVVPVITECLRDETCPLRQFSDLNVDAWYHDGIHYCVENGLIKGYPSNEFKPNGKTTRPMMVTILARIDGQDTESGASWDEVGKSWAKANGILDGIAEEGNITREEFATMLYRYAKLNGQGFTGSWMFLLNFKDANKVSDLANEAVHWCVMKGIMQGKGGTKEGMLDPQGELTRTEAAAMIQRFVDATK